MYRYIHTTTDTMMNSVAKDILEGYVNGYLFSLYNGFTQQNFGYQSLYNISKRFEAFHNRLKNNEFLIADSGGYSVIVGDVSPNHISILLDCYNYFLEQQCHTFDYIMSLDIPIFLKYQSYNTTEHIYRFNAASCARSKQVLDRHPELYDKFIFVWQFKIRKQFNIWRKIFDLTFAEEPRLKHFAIGGLVGLRGITNIKFSPFIAPAYRNLKLIHDRNNPDTSILHILGVYGRHDRFIMQFMDKLFNEHYLKNKECSVDITFDTINYTLTGLYKIREFPLFKFLNIDVNQDRKTFIDAIEPYFLNKNVLGIIADEVELFKQGKPFKDTGVLSHTYILYSQLVDQQMKEIIEKYNLLDMFLNAPNYNALKSQLWALFKGLERIYPHAIKNLTNQLLSNFHWLHSFHRAWETGADLQRIDNGILKFIDAINFPGDLEGEFDY